MTDALEQIDQRLAELQHRLKSGSLGAGAVAQVEDQVDWLLDLRNSLAVPA